ncbi:glycoside hydrolase [Lactarius quietus]|nr:glycoside hydrolase [Lactarius quietus]
MHILWLLLPFVPSVTPSSFNDSNSLLWGTYRPNLYFGLRPRIPQSVMTGLVWFGTQDYQSFSKARHACDQGDGLDGYTWTQFDPREGGIQVVKDSHNNVKVTTELLKVAGGEHGGSWAARIKGEPIIEEQPSRTSFIFYAGLEGMGGLDLETDEDENVRYRRSYALTGFTPELDDFTIRVVDGPNNEVYSGGLFADAFAQRIGKTHYSGFRVPAGNIWQAKGRRLQSLIDHTTDRQNAGKAVEGITDMKQAPDPSFTLQLSDETYSGSNLFAIQKFFDGKFQFDVFFESRSANTNMNSATLDEGIAAFSASFAERFNRVFPVPDSPRRDALEEFSQAITSNLLGGVGYFYGTSIVDPSFSNEWDDDAHDDKQSTSRGPHLTEPKALLTATPSRSFFPRGFYWDEGFHLLHVGEWDNDLSLEILKDWVDLIDDDGWVAREQILGEEARSKVPEEFRTQVPSFANPPTLTMAVTAFIKRLSRHAGPTDQDLGLDFATGGSQVPLVAPPTSHGNRYLEDRSLALSFLQSIYQPLKRHYEWFKRTQRGQLKQYGRKARSRLKHIDGEVGQKTHLTSGMDDYPRAPPHTGELHLDLLSWMGFFSRTMKEIAEFIGENEDRLYYANIEKAVIDNLDDLHWSEESQMYCDIGVDDDDESYHVCHKGYLSVFPFLLSLLPPESPHLGSVLDLLRDPQHLWSPYGLRSLSASHPDFGTGENYWRGPIWIQMNYLALQALHETYAVHEGPHQDKARSIYTELRQNIIDNVFKEYERTGYVWEQYDANTGEGRRSHPFTGWTSLVTLILSEKY